MKISKAITEFMKKLRPYIHGDVKKLDVENQLGWIIDDGVIVEIEYLCRADQGAVKDCYPHTVKVYLGSLQQSRINPKKKRIEKGNNNIFRSRRYEKRSNGTLNVESVALAIQKAKEADEVYKQNEKDRKDAKNHREKELEKTLKFFKKHTPRKGRSNQSYNKFSFMYSMQEDQEESFEFRINQNSPEKPIDVSIDVDGIDDHGKAVEIIEAIHEILCK